MKLRVTAALCVLVLLAADKPAEKKADELEGVWDFVTAVDGGNEQKPPAGGFFHFQAGGKLTTKFGDDKREAVYTADPTKKPHTLDLTPGDGPFQGKTIKLIYFVEGDTLTLCGGHGPEDPRPTEFTSKQDSKQVLLTLKREKK